MIFLDTICFNMDRHTNNYGIFREVETGNILGLAPNFDNNISLVSRGYPKNIERKNDKLIELFKGFLKKNNDALKCFENLEFPKIDEELINKCLDKVQIQIDRDFICNFILNAYEQIMNPSKDRLEIDRDIG